MRTEKTAIGKEKAPRRNPLKETVASKPRKKLMRTEKSGSAIEEQKHSRLVNANEAGAISVRANTKKAHVIVALCLLGGLLCISSIVFLYFRKHIGFVDEAVHGMSRQSTISFSANVDVHNMNQQAASDSDAIDEYDDDEEEKPMTKMGSMEREAPAPAAVPTHTDTTEFATGKFLRSARAWKFSASRSRRASVGTGEVLGETPLGDLMKMSNWRRRSFFVKKTLPDNTNNGQEKVGLLLINAGTGELKLLAMLEVFELLSDESMKAAGGNAVRTGVKAAEVREMEQVQLPELDEATIQEVCTSLQTYDVCFKENKVPISSAEYREAIPSVFFPISITWKDENEITCTNIIALESDAKRQTWMKSLKAVMEAK